MTARQKLKIRSIPISEIAVSHEGRNGLTRSVLRNKGLEVPEGRKLAEAAKEHTLGDAMDVAEKRGAASRYLVETLVGMGMTYLDWNLLPPETAAEKIGRLNKATLLSLDVRVLRAFSHKALRRIGYHILKKEWAQPPALPRITIAELIAGVTLPAISRDDIGSFRISFLKAKEQLERLGFRYGNGPFFQEGTKRKAIEVIAAKHGIGKRKAEKIVAVAIAEGWFKPMLG